MNPSLLERIILRFPGAHPEFHSLLISLLAHLGQPGPHGLEFSVSDGGYSPRISLLFDSPHSAVEAEFHSAGEPNLAVPIENTTGRKKRNSISYRPIPIASAAKRLSEAGIKILRIDHVGFNLPWFEPGLHPNIIALRRRLASACLYHEYPSGEPWDFILPGTPEEILGRKPVDYAKNRRPKFELVSFAACSTPLVQIDLHVDAPSEGLSAVFPEGWADSQFGNVWLYLESPYPPDICLVINKASRGDWSDFFVGHRISAAAGNTPPGD